MPEAVLAPWSDRVRTLPLFRRLGRVTRVTDISVEATGPKVALGEVCRITTDGGDSIEAEVVALKDQQVVLMPYGPCKGLTVGSQVLALDTQPCVAAGTALLGHVVDAFGQPLDGAHLPGELQDMPLHPPPLNPMQRAPVQAQLPTGVRVIDALLPLGRGQRLGIFAGSGVGKTSLLGMLAQHVEAEIVVIALIGERGREVREFLETRLDARARSRTVAVVATAEQPAVVRARAAYAATAIAEHFREAGRDVLLVMDSVTRFAMARREIDLAAGQPPTSRGYTPSVFSAIPALCERCGGLAGGGSITALYTVLVEGDDVTEPVSDALRATLDGHVVLSRELANDGHFPAIDVLQSVSRLDTALLPTDEMQRARRLRLLLAVHRRQREMVEMGLYKAGTNEDLDAALRQWPAITAFLRQAQDEHTARAQTREALARMLADEVRA